MAHRWPTGIGMVAVSLLTSCATKQVERSDLVAVVDRDAIAFDASALPTAWVDALAANRVVLVGETHGLIEHGELVVALLARLHAHGLRQAAFEWPQAADWLATDYVTDGGIAPDFAPPTTGTGALLTLLRDFNRTLPATERIRARGIDVMLPDYGGTASFNDLVGMLAGWLPTAEPLTAFVTSAHATPAEERSRLDTLDETLSAHRSTLTIAWGDAWFDTVREMVEVERASVTIREIRDSDYDRSVRLREDMMKRLADRRILEATDGLVINVGSTHAQKSRMRGTDIEWLGDYLVHGSAAVDGSILVLDVAPARILTGTTTVWSLTDASPDNELFRVMHESAPDRVVVLSLDDPLFLEDGVPLNFEDTIYMVAPKVHYDVLVVLPEAHRVPR